MAAEEYDSRSRHRSRAYPAIDLRDAIERAEQLSKAEGFGFAPAEIVIEHWGHSRGSSHGMRGLAALIQYGLMEEGEKKNGTRQVKLTKLARVILQHPKEEERMKAIQEAALTPTLYREIWDKYSELPSDAVLEWNLKSSGDLNEKIATSFVKKFRDTLEFAGLKKGGNLLEDLKDVSAESDKADDEEEIVYAAPLSQVPKAMTNITPHAAQPFDLPILLPTGEQAVLRMPVTQTLETYRHLVRALKLNLRLMQPAITRDSNNDTPADRDQTDDKELWEEDWPDGQDE